MRTLLLEDFINEPILQVDDPEGRLLINHVNWQRYEAFLDKLGDGLGYRVTYLEGTLEIMSPSRRHEVSKKDISRLLETYLIETRTKFWALGSTTFRLEEKQGGTEPDESYCIGTNKEFPDLVIEIVLSSGGIDKLSIYQRLGIKEVWFWQNEQFYLYSLEEERYQQISQSKILPDLDLDLLTQYINHPNPLESILEFREIIHQRIANDT
jgi:Uma2 family endonuclease